MQPEQALLGQAGRERRQVVCRSAVRRVRGRPYGVGRAVTLRPGGNGLRQLQMFFGQAKRHGSPRLACVLTDGRNSRTRFGFRPEATRTRFGFEPPGPRPGWLAGRYAAWRQGETQSSSSRSGRRRYLIMSWTEPRASRVSP